MTANQIAYWNLQELKRTNQAKEAESARSNRAQESLQSQNLLEVKRHNLATEANDLTRLQETERHNLSTELEQQRSNMAREWNDTQRRLEEKRANIEREIETARTNRMNESIRASQAAAVERSHQIDRGKLALEQERFGLQKTLGTVDTGSKAVDTLVKVVMSGYKLFK